MYVTLHRRINRRTALIGIGAAATAGLGATRLVLAQTPEGSPEASPAAQTFPQGPLGEHLQWLQDALNTEGGPTVEEVQEHLAPESEDLPSAEEIAATITELGAEGGPYTIDTETMIMTMDFPPSHASFRIHGEAGGKLNGGLVIDIDSGLIRGFSLSRAGEGTPAASPEVLN
jgi:hypothetical protein